MMRLFPQPLAVTVAGLLMAAGCSDPLASGDYAPVYLTLDGRVTGLDQMHPQGPVRIVLLWQSDNSGAPNYTGQLGAVHTELGTFTLGLNALPPAPVVYHPTAQLVASTTLDPSMRWAASTIVVFDDVNDNGQLDLVGSAAATSPDRVLGASTNVDLFLLLQGRPADPAQFLDLFPTTTGFSLAQAGTLLDPTFFDCGFYDSRGRHESVLCAPTADPAHPAVTLPLTTQIAIDLPTDPDAQDVLQGFACSSFWGARDYPDITFATVANECDDPTQCAFCTGESCPLDVPPAGVPVSCNSDGTAFVYKVCTPDPTRCNTRFCHYGHGERLATDPPLAGWPCP
jgi:hypothetical protein